LDLDPDLDEQRMAVYIAYKLESNILTIVPKSDHLTVYVDMPFEEVVDHEGMIRDVSQIGHLGSGEVMFDVGEIGQLEAALDLASQSLRWHKEH
jgi:predicted transport protein